MVSTRGQITSEGLNRRNVFEFNTSGVVSKHVSYHRSVDF
jgi:hypothetical protein